MGTPAQIGKNEWRAAIRVGRIANAELREVLKRILQEGELSTRALAGQAALLVADNEKALDRLEEIGRNAKEIDS